MAINKVSMNADLGELAELIGSFEGWEQAVSSKRYLTDLIEYSHGVTSKKFDEETAVVARALNIGHMYEWGTTGINKGTGALNPTTRASKLWVHRLMGSGSNRSIDFSFRPSTVAVPRPEGIPDGRKHIFHQKAMVTEMGISVTIKPKYAKALMIPLNGKKSTSPFQNYRDRNEKRGYVMYPANGARGGIVRLPASPNAGNFQAHWLSWWNTAGKATMTAATDKIVQGDAEAVIKTGKRGTRSTIRSSKRNIKGTFKLQVSTAKAKAYSEARQREAAVAAQAEAMKATR